MTVGFFLALRNDVSHFLHGSALAYEVKRVMPGVEVVQFTDGKTPMVPGADRCVRFDGEAPLLEQRLSLYASVTGEWLFVDTDVSVRNDVRGLFADPVFDVAVCDRNWPHLVQGETMMQTMPFNTGVCLTRCQPFWRRVLARWQSYPEHVKRDWLSEQQAVYDVVRSGRFRVKILPGMIYNYPPKSADDRPIVAAMLHYKGPRKPWRSALAMQTLAG